MDAFGLGRTQVARDRPGRDGLRAPWATVWRMPVADGVVFVKECHGRWRVEAALTAAVAAAGRRHGGGPRRRPGPGVVSCSPMRASGWSTSGTHPSCGPTSLPRYAELQRGETAHASRASRRRRARPPDHGSPRVSTTGCCPSPSRSKPRSSRGSSRSRRRSARSAPSSRRAHR